MLSLVAARDTPGGLLAARVVSVLEPTLDAVSVVDAVTDIGAVVSTALVLTRSEGLVSVAVGIAP